jgi:tetratricopeptide (TPR) repeat protein
MQRGILGAVCMLVIWVYAYAAHSGLFEALSMNPADTHYNLLVQGFRAGQLSLKKEVPPGLAQLADSYDPTANLLYRYVSYRLHDLSYYKGKVYLYFGVTPALILFWPFAALTGHYLFDKQGVVIFCAIGFLASVVLLRALWRRYFAEVSVGVVAACALALGLATFVPVMLSRCDVYEVAISCGYMLTMLALGAIWCALHEPERRCRWLAAASLLYGLAVGARPSLVFGAVILLVPVAQAWRERRQIWAPLIGATGPIMIIGLGLMLYNILRFDSPFEFGWRYMLTAYEPGAVRRFSLRNLWFNFHVYFLEPSRWSTRFPFVHDIAVPPLPAGYGLVESPFGVLTNVPLVWLALAVPLAWRSRSGPGGLDLLRRFVMALAMLFGICALTLGLFFAACVRYEVDFLPTLALLAVVGILGLERALADRPVWRRAVRWGWGLLLGFSVVFNLLASVEHYLATVEHNAEIHNSFAVALGEAGRVQEAIERFEETLRIRPGYAEAHYNLAVVLIQVGRVEDAIGHYEQAVRFKPDWAEAHNTLANALVQAGRVEDAIGHYEQTLRSDPDNVGAHSNLAWLLATDGDQRLRDPARAVKLAERACELTGKKVPAPLDTLAAAYAAAGRFEEAIRTAQEAINVALAAGEKELADEIQGRLELYKSGQPFHRKPAVKTATSAPPR